MKQLFSLFLLLTFCIPTLAAQKVKVSCVGNSITYGYTLADPATQSYPARLQILLGDGYEVRNFGKSGATLLNQGHRPYMKQEEFGKAMAFAGDVVIIHLGINDTDPRDWPNYRDEFVHDYLQLIDSLRSVNPKAKVLICKLTPLSSRHPRFLSGTRDWRDEIQQAIETVAKYAHTEVIDLDEPLYRYHHLLLDAVHPNAEGAQIIANTVYSAITGNYGGLKLSQLYSDNMVLQRNHYLTISGMANAGSEVTVAMGRNKATAKAEFNGKWTAQLDSIPAGGPYELQIKSGKQQMVFKNVMVGEVWLCSGQSNMEFMLKQASTGAQDIPNAQNNSIRLFDMKARWRTDDVQWPSSVLDSVNRLEYYKPTTWSNCTSSSAANFSAVAYYFGRMLQDSLKVPVGLICNAIGGSPTEAWIDRYTLEHDFPVILNDWKKNDFVQDWVRERAIVNIGKDAFILQRHPYEPCYLFEAGILPLEHFDIKGIIWYQGESNAHNKDAYEQLFPLLVKSWRNYFKEKLPFYYVQLSSLDRPSWTWFRDGQRLMLHEDEAMGMAVSSDCGDSLNVHPRMKYPIGERLARWALARTYDNVNVVPSGPLVDKAFETDGKVCVSFRYGVGLRTSDGKSLNTFEVAEDEGMYYPAQAEIKDDKVWLSCPQIKHPKLVRYGWQPFTRANLVNAEALPASTFRVSLNR